MSRGVGFIATLIVVAIGAYVYLNQTQTLTQAGSNPTTTIDVTAVRNDLFAIANAERRYSVSNGKYASLEDLRTGGDIHIPTRSHFSYFIEATDSSFKVIATYSGPDPKAPRRISIDDTMQMKTE